jgi:DUF1365 family protein
MAFDPVARLYAGRVGHVRHAPAVHKFEYRIWMMAVDVDGIDQLKSWLFRHNRFGLLSLHDKDHGFRDARSLRAFAEQTLAAAGLGAFAARITFVTMPRFLGYAFNPISFYFCHDAAGKLGAVVHQVKNTFGDQVSYVMPVSGADLRGRAAKRMHVSPFFDMQGGYKFALTAPAEKLNVSIVYGTETEKRMTAWMTLERRPWRDAARLLLEMPLTPLKVIFAIHWQALKLFVLRGAKFHGVPATPHDPVYAGER